jgi:uncharacterized protein with HEPN domain
MSRSTADRLRDIIHSAELVALHAGSFDPPTLATMPLQQDACLFRLVVVCEAASRLPAEVQALAPDIPWAKIRNTRNHLVHGYWQIDLSIVVETVANDIMPLKAAAERLIEVIERNRS